ncbi:hypothetical protein DYB32_001263 [Aphanomyces invadans]|uniref:Uncharacterized protein n=1 Tax=Aphanomyces invadans TaxID=157072 RepID=A0A418B6Z8_9STRA|nr:hypothetical protein DYB32_001263 [Aphanomyces invadans]
MHAHFDLDAYLTRINLTVQELAASPTHSFAQLSLLVQHHRLAIPFENLAACRVFPVDPAHADVSIGERVSLHPARIFRKLVLDRRGGWCFEQNALLATALRALGYAVETICGRVIAPAVDSNKGKYLAKAMTHMLLLVTIDTNEQFLCDVGFGARGEPPIPIRVSPTSTKTTMASGESYEVGLANVVRHMHADTWTGDFYVDPSTAPDDFSATDRVLCYQKGPTHPVYPVYVFSPDARLAHVDYEMANWYSSTHPHNRFTQIPICTKRTVDGFVTLAGNEFKETRHGETVRTNTIDPDELLDLLKSTFGLVRST